MKLIKLVATAVVLVTTQLSAYSQMNCGFDQFLNKKQQDPAYRKAMAEQEAAISRYIAAHKQQPAARGNGTSNTLYTMPIVVHVLNAGEPIGSQNNPDDAQLLEAVDYLNACFNGTYPGIQGAGDMQIQFVMARRDPLCQPTNGIDRVNAAYIPLYAEHGLSLAPLTRKILKPSGQSLNGLLPIILIFMW